jgi:predicted kinase
MLLMVGLPGAGKTTRAEELAAMHQALRLTPDHWMIPLFGDSMADGKRWILEGRLISVALQALRLGISVVLDYGLWDRDERSALRWLARRSGQNARWFTGPWTKTSSSPASHTARQRHRIRHSR